MKTSVGFENKPPSSAILPVQVEVEIGHQDHLRFALRRLDDDA